MHYDQRACVALPLSRHLAVFISPPQCLHERRPRWKLQPPLRLLPRRMVVGIFEEREGDSRICPVCHLTSSWRYEHFTSFRTMQYKHVFIPPCQILCLLEPRDLLNLARTSKPFRGLLMSRNSVSMWKASRSNVEGLPDCPAHLSEPAYANLAFFPYCNVGICYFFKGESPDMRFPELPQAKRPDNIMGVQQAILSCLPQSKVSIVSRPSLPQVSHQG